MAVFAGIDDTRAAQIADRVSVLAGKTKYLVPSHDPDAAEFDGDCYLRGPVWLIVNYKIAIELSRGGQQETADRIIASSFDFICKSGRLDMWTHTQVSPVVAPNSSGQLPWFWNS